jgi:hypothetical protein
MVFLRVPPSQTAEPLLRQFVRLDPLGTLLFLPGIFSFLLALQWGGVSYPWNNARIIALFVVAGVLVIGFIIIQAWRREDATVPPRIIRQRSVLSGAIYSACVGGALVSMLYTLALWFQAVKGTTAVHSGIDTIPLVLSLVVGAIFSGGVVTKTGYYAPWIFVCSILMSIGTGLMTTFQRDTGHATWIGYQVLLGLGIGTGMQQPSLAAQAVLSQADVPIGVSMMFFAQSLGGAVFVCIGQSLFTNYLSSNLTRLPGIDVETLLSVGTTDIVTIVPPNQLSAVLDVYNAGLREAFIVALAVSCLSIVPALGIEWKSTRATAPKNSAE